MIKILFIGDVVGRPGRRVLRDLLPGIRREFHLDLVVANGENSAGGAGITRKTAKEIFSSGVDVITSGDHLWDQRDVMGLLEEEPAFLRPVNYPANTPGNGWGLFPDRNENLVCVINAQGRTFMTPLENPFTAVLRVLDQIRDKTKVVLLDFHAEATSEKLAMGRMLDGRVSLVVGTHTHIQTADEQILSAGTAFLCDVGFTGAQDGILGREARPVIEKFLTAQPRRFTLAKRDLMLKAVLVEVDPSTGRAVSIQRFNRTLNSIDEECEEDSVS